MQRAAAVQTQQSARSLKTRSQSMGTPPLKEQLGSLSLAGVAEGGSSDAVTLRAVPTQLAKAVPAHDGGCLTCAFDRLVAGQGPQWGRVCGTEHQLFLLSCGLVL